MVMYIQSTKRVVPTKPSSRPEQKSSVQEESSLSEVSQSPFEKAESVKSRRARLTDAAGRASQVPWRKITLNEAAVEIPQSLLELSDLGSKAPLTATGIQAGISGLAMFRAVECFYDAKSLEEVLEGISSGALALAGGATLLPTANAALWNQGFLVGHGASELALGIREVSEELKKDKPARLELAAGFLDSVKGASTFIPLIFPEAAEAVNIFQIGAIVTKTVMEPHMERSRNSAK
jgi:hypothetical protein